MQSKAELIDGLVTKLSALLSNSSSGASLKDDAQRNVKAAVQAAFSKLDIVSRDEFEAQVAVLKRSREKIDQLESQLAELTEQLNQQ